MEPTSPEIVREWLSTMGLSVYLDSFLDNGYDDLVICQQIGEEDLDAIGVVEEKDRLVILQEVEKLKQISIDSYYTLEQNGQGIFSYESRQNDVNLSFLLNKSLFLSQNALAEKFLDLENENNSVIGEGESCTKLADSFLKYSQEPWSPATHKLTSNTIETRHHLHLHPPHHHHGEESDDFKMFSVYGQTSRSTSPPYLPAPTCISHPGDDGDHGGGDQGGSDDNDKVVESSGKSLSRRGSEKCQDGQKNNGSETSKNLSSHQREQGLKELVVNTITKLMRSVTIRCPQKKYVHKQHQGDLRASEMMMNEEERMDLMFQVKSGKMTVKEAVQRVNSYKGHTSDNFSSSNRTKSVFSIGKSRSMDEGNFSHHYHNQQHHRCHGNWLPVASPFSNRKLNNIHLPVDTITRNQRIKSGNRSRETPEGTGKNPRLSPPPLPPLPLSDIIESLSVERLHHRYHHHHHHPYGHDDDDDDDDDSRSDHRLPAHHRPILHHPPDILPINFTQLHYHHRLPHLYHHGGYYGDGLDYNHCVFCSVRKSRSLHWSGLGRSPHTNTRGCDWVSPYGGKDKEEWRSTEELKTLRFLRQCTAERYKFTPDLPLPPRPQEAAAAAIFNGDKYINGLKQSPATARDVSRLQTLQNNQSNFHYPFQQQQYHHQRQLSLPTSSSLLSTTKMTTNCQWLPNTGDYDGWRGGGDEFGSIGQRSRTIIDLFKRIGFQHLTEKFLVDEKLSMIDGLSEMKEDDLDRIGVDDELDRIKLLTVAQFIQNCHQYFGED